MTALAMNFNRPVLKNSYLKEMSADTRVPRPSFYYESSCLTSNLDVVVNLQCFHEL